LEQEKTFKRAEKSYIMLLSLSFLLDTTHLAVVLLQ